MPASGPAGMPAVAGAEGPPPMGATAAWAEPVAGMPVVAGAEGPPPMGAATAWAEPVAGVPIGPPTGTWSFWRAGGTRAPEPTPWLLVAGALGSTEGAFKDVGSEGMVA